MAGDIYSRIRQAAFELVGEGVWPTVVEVRARLGTGSNTTINNTLKEWRQEFLARMSHSARHPDWPAGVAEAFAQLWHAACAAAEQQWETLRQEAEGEVTIARQAEAAALQRLEATQASLQSAQRELELRGVKLQDLDDQLRAERSRIDLLQQDRQKLEAQLTAAREEAQTARLEADARVADIEKRADQRVLDERAEAERREALAYERLDGLRVRLYQQLEDERQSMRQAQESLAEELQVARQQAAQSDNAWRERLADRDREAGRLSARLELLEQRNRELEDMAQRHSVLSEQASARLLDMAGENARLAGEMSGRLERQLQRLSAAMHDARQELSLLDEAGIREWIGRQMQLPLA
ncbi:DNA-binding protein [uncultured Aquitalea sp.]|uniref:DNA-binding protein n=1 Tax=uncultured Aquitalea sp. TaxID=540272 RepID=UPI0025E5E51B|nr:DNA-binding protein [uncultured Aquitalea sp.]